MPVNPYQTPEADADTPPSTPDLAPGWSSISVSPTDQRANSLVATTVIAYGLSCIVYSVFTEITINSHRPPGYFEGTLFGLVVLLWLMVKAVGFRRNTHAIVLTSSATQADHSPAAVEFTWSVAVVGFIIGPLVLTFAVVFIEMGITPFLMGIGMGAFWLTLALWSVNRILLRWKSRREVR